MLRRSLLAKVTTLSALLFVAGVTLTGCDKKPVELKVGATAGSHVAIVEQAAQEAKKQGLNVKVIEFTDYISPNRALEDGALDVVVYQHEPFLNNYNKQYKTHLKYIGGAVVQPMGFYSDKIRALKDIPEGTKVSIPNDPTNSGRALVLLQNAGLIKLKPGTNGDKALIADIIENPKNLKILELEAAQLPRSLGDVGFACIPMNYVTSAGLSPKKQGFFFEDLKAPYARIIIASRVNNADNEAVKKFVSSYQSKPVAEFIKKTFDGAIIPAWEQK